MRLTCFYLLLRCDDQESKSMKIRIIIYCLLLATLCVGCNGRRHMRKLESLEAQLDTAPHLVQRSLDSIPFAALRGEPRALYALLKTQADYKCFVPITSDTLIRYATDYYDGKCKNYRAAMAHYSLGCVYSELNNDAAAIESYLRAQSLFPDTTVRYYGLCYQNLGLHYLKKNMADEALEAFSLCHNIVVGYGLICAKIGMARAYIRKRMPQQAQVILEELLLHQKTLDRVSLENTLFELGKIEHSFNKDYTKADAYFSQLIALYDEGKVDVAHWFKGDIAEQHGDTALAIQYYKETMQGNDDVYLLYNCARSLQYLSIDSIAQPELYSYVKLFEQMGDSINRIERLTEIDEIHTAHAMELQQRELSEKHKRFMYIATSVLVCLLAGIAIGVLLIEQRRKHHYLRLQQELQRNQAKVYKMYESIESKRDNGALMREQVLSLYRANLETSIALFHRESWHRRLQQLSELRSKDVASFTIKERDQLTEVLERCFITVITNLRDEAAKQEGRLSAEDIHLCLLLSLGYSIGVIRECQAASSDDVIRKRKVRLAGKLPEDILWIFEK